MSKAEQTSMSDNQGKESPKDADSARVLLISGVIRV
jgi:hypothetical protein